MNDKFSHNITLFEYQKKALEKAKEFLEEIFDNQVLNIKKAFDFYYYKDVSVKDLKLNDIKIGNNYFSELYLRQKTKTIPFSNLANRCSFWMATGSGKSLVMIKLIELLDELMIDKIKKNNILILAPTDTILEQIKFHIDLYNSYHTSKPIKLKNLKDFDGEIADFNGEIVVYYYRSNNIVDSESKDKQLNFNEFLNNGNWYLILDEAHKGESKNSLSKRKSIFSLIAKNGVIFNFSATFTDEIDKKTVIFDFKLDKFLNAGYGKKIMLLDDSVSVNENYQLENIAKSLILLAQIRKDYKKIRKYGTFYHSPLMMTIANTVNTPDADLKIFFQKLLEIAKENFDFNKLVNDLNQELKNKEYMFNLGILKRNINLTFKEFFQYVFNASSGGDIEYSYSENKNELLFKLKNSEEYFMLIYAGNVIKWGEDVLNGFIPLKTLDSNVFSEINTRDEISILMGSRMFIEGWDTNRVNIINFVELGKNDAEKLILQSIGRGVRIEPIKNKRMRLEYLDNETKKNINNYDDLIMHNEFIESLFIFPSKKEYIESVLNELKKVSDNKKCIEFKEVSKNPRVNDYKDFLCIPELKESEKFNNSSFYVSEKSQQKLLDYLKNFDYATFILKHNITTRTLKNIKNKNFKNSSENIEVKKLISMLNSYWNKKVKEVIGFKVLTDEIIHYQKMCGYLTIDEIKELEKDLKEILKRKKCPDDKKEEEKLKNALEVNKKLGIETFLIEEKLKTLKISKFFPEMLECKLIMEHFYLPILYKEDSDKFMHIIKHKSEIEFLKDLENYLKNNELKCKWMFSKVDESVDNIKIPYFDTQKGEYRYFYPDFVFWIKKGNKKKIVFVDPKGKEHLSNPYDKMRGFIEVKNRSSEFNDECNILEIELYFYNKEMKNKEMLNEEYQRHWIDDTKFDEIFKIKEEKC